MTAFFILLGVAVLTILAMSIALHRRMKISPAVRKKILAQWDHASSLKDLNAQILEADKVLDAVLNALGYKGTVGEKLKVAGPRLREVDAIWRAHKLRNRIAHEPGVKITEREAKQAMKAFRYVVETFVR